MWRVPLGAAATTGGAAIEDSTNEVVNNVYELPSTKKVIRFLHAALGFPTKATLTKAINKSNLAMFPGLTAENVNKFFPESDETQKGHMKQ